MRSSKATRRKVGSRGRGSSLNGLIWTEPALVEFGCGKISERIGEPKTSSSRHSYNDDDTRGRGTDGQ
jgi:hypothetical protein